MTRELCLSRRGGCAARMLPRRLPGLRNLWNFGASNDCLITGTRLVDGPSAYRTPEGTWFVGAGSGASHAHTSYATLDWTPGDCTIVIGYRGVSGSVAWSLMSGFWNGWYGTAGSYILQTANADFAGQVSPGLGASRNDPVRVFAISCATNDFRACCDGGDVAADTATTRPTLSGSAILRLGGAWSDNPADVHVQVVALFDRISTDEQLRAYSANPWGTLFEPELTLVPAPALLVSYRCPQVLISRAAITRASAW